MATWEITCPFCGWTGDDSEGSFNVSLCGECFCPRCNESFELNTDIDDDDEDNPDA